MGNKNYETGYRFENRVRHWLKDRGYYVIRAYGSKGTFDLVAVPPKNSRLSRAILIQAKYSRKNKVQISTEEKDRLADAARRYKGFCFIVFNEHGKIKWRLVNPYRKV